tara:strand:+ start:973 stop:2247 length:1275 start_codon:yes stop_codon:yes gene_type:complete
MLNSIQTNCSAWVIQLLIVMMGLWSTIAAAEVEAEAEPFIKLQAEFPFIKLPPEFQIHGFASQSYINTTGKNDVFGDSSGDGSFNFREIGLNASYRPLPNLQFALQILSRSAGVGNDGGVRVDYGFVDYSAISDETKQMGIRLGRMKNPLGFYNDTRDVPFTRPSILLPQSIYFDRTRNLGLAADGAQVYSESRTEFGDIFFQFGAVLPIVNDRETEVAAIGGNLPGKLTTKPSYIGRLQYERDGGRLRFAISGAQVNMSYDPARPFGQDILAGEFHFIPLIFSAQYNTERWSFTSEYAFRFFRLKDFGVPALDLNFTGESYYFQGIYRFTPKWEGVLRYDALFTDRSDRSGKRAAAATGRPAHTRFARDITVGLRWNITPSLMLRTEYHRVNGTAWLSTLDNPSSQDTSKNWNLFAAQISYRF